MEAEGQDLSVTVLLQFKVASSLKIKIKRCRVDSALRPLGRLTKGIRRSSSGGEGNKKEEEVGWGLGEYRRVRQDAQR